MTKIIKASKHGIQVIKQTLDQLMGVNRNGDRPDAVITDYNDDRVCKYDLVGVCPYQLFPNTKHYDLGPCPFQCCPAPKTLKQDYNNDMENGRAPFKYELEAKRFYEDLVRKVDEKKQIIQSRLDEQNKMAGYIAPSENTALKEVIEKMNSLITQIESLGTEGKIEEAASAMEQLEKLKKEREVLEERPKKSNQQELMVCDVCAATLSVNETDQRLADHFAGKAHLGYQILRDKLRELREKHAKAPPRELRDNHGPPRGRGGFHRREQSPYGGGRGGGRGGFHRRESSPYGGGGRGGRGGYSRKRSRSPNQYHGGDRGGSWGGDRRSPNRYHGDRPPPRRDGGGWRQQGPPSGDQYLPPHKRPRH